ncbi:hypothetical protein [Nonomuraea composti]|uniref:hypothetical protein n=1 Tax=Nonomuraea composti TaxID=2720023 RepID=UPI00197EA475|nr:hypothetical protein [Nonomuraea sp. FMUSA5-5]
MLHTVLRRKAAEERVEDIRENLITGTGKRMGENPSLPASTGGATGIRQKRAAR